MKGLRVTFLTPARGLREKRALDTQPLWPPSAFAGASESHDENHHDEIQLMCFLPALGKGMSTQPNSGINYGGSKDPDENALATKP